MIVGRTFNTSQRAFLVVGRATTRQIRLPPVVGTKRNKLGKKFDSDSAESDFRNNEHQRSNHEGQQKDADYSHGFARRSNLENVT